MKAYPVKSTWHLPLVIGSLILSSQMAASAYPADSQLSITPGLDRTGFMPGGWDRNDLRTDAETQTAVLDRTGFVPGGWDLNDLRTDAAAQTPALDKDQFIPGGWDGNDLRTDSDSITKSKAK